jgi:hypothetical protein
VEELLIVLLQAFGEVILQVLIYLPFELPWTSSRESETGASGCGWAFFYLFVGVGLGWVSTLVFRHVLLPHPALRIANLVVAPLACGTVSWLLARGRAKRGGAGVPEIHFFLAAVFAFAFASARFVWATR